MFEAILDFPFRAAPIAVLALLGLALT